MPWTGNAAPGVKYFDRLWISRWISTGSNVQNTGFCSQANSYPPIVQPGYTVFQRTCKRCKPMKSLKKTCLSTKNPAFTITTIFVYIYLSKPINAEANVGNVEKRRHLAPPDIMSNPRTPGKAGCGPWMRSRLSCPGAGLPTYWPQWGWASIEMSTTSKNALLEHRLPGTLAGRGRVNRNFLKAPVDKSFDIHRVECAERPLLSTGKFLSNYHPAQIHRFSCHL